MRAFKRKNNIFSNNVENRKKEIMFPIILWLGLGLLSTILIESLNRGSLTKTIIFIFGSFSLFLLNYFIVLSITSIAFLFKKTKSVYTILAGLIVLFGISDGVVMKFRGTPITAADMYSIKDGASIAKEYIGVFEFVLIIIALISFIVGIVIMFRREKKSKYFSCFKNIGFIIIPIIILTCGLAKYNTAKGKIKTYRWDLTATYNNNGFLISFINSAKELIPTKPETYTQERMNNINSKIEEKSVAVSAGDTKPNIIVVQLESFVDPYRLQGVEFESDPIPNIRKLQGESQHGFMKVPCFGGGTVRTEFEVLTGYSANNLGPGEIPNNTVLKKQSVESLAYILKNQGYGVTAVHDYIGNFYNRDTVYANFGFDNLVSMEYMDNLQYTYDYPSDMNNMPVIDTLINKKDPQFIFNVAVESHGPYDKEYKAEKYTVTGDMSDENKNQLQEYLDKAMEVDRYVESLINYVKESGEPTILAIYSDHLPALGMISDKKYFPQDKKYESEYYIWSNMGNEELKKDINAYQLSTEVLNLANVKGGLMPTFHNTYMKDEKYDEYLKDVQYDQLYGSNYLLGKNAYTKADMKLGIDNVKINKAYIEGNQLVVEGENLTKASKIIVDGKVLKTTYDNDSKIVAIGYGKNINKIEVGQEGMYGKMLSKSNEIKLSEN